MRLALICIGALASGSIVDDVRNLAQLHDEGLLTHAEYAMAKQRAVMSAFPQPLTPSGHNTTGPYVTIDCASDDDPTLTKVLTVILPGKSTPLDIRSLCPDVVGFSGDTVKLRPMHVPERADGP